MNKKITVQTEINAPATKVWEFYTSEEHIPNWNNASDDWHTPSAKNDLRPGGKFDSRMEAKDGSAGFNFTGTYNDVKENELITYTMDDDRQVEIKFEDLGESTKVTVIFDAEEENSIELQQQGWQAILDNFKSYVESYQS